MDEEQMVKDNMGLVGLFMSKNPKPKWISHDEYESELKVGLWNSVRNHKEDHESGAKFSTYAMVGMGFALKKIIRDKYRRDRFGTDFGIDTAQAREEVEQREFPIKAQDCLQFLDGEDKEMMQTFLSGKSISEIARSAGKSRQSVSKRWMNCIRKIRRRIRECGIASFGYE